MLELRGITKAYRTASLTQRALDSVSLAFRDNEFVAILGQSGSGKTTMLNIIGGLDHFDSGDLLIDSISTKNYRDRDWDAYRNNRIGFVFQAYNLIPHQSVLENVELALTLSGVSRKERRARALEALEGVGLADHVRKKPSQLSGGQMQRVAIARALVNDPEIVLADEPTGALDSQTSTQVMDLLHEVASDRLVIMVTHNPELAEQYATRIVELSDGRVISDTRPYEPAGEEIREAKAARRTSMSPLTALGLSAKNLATKKWRTLMTSFAGSIGIIGIASILALANGVNDYIARTEENALTSYPLSIQKTGMDMSAMLGANAEGAHSQSGVEGKVKTIPAFASTRDSTTRNDLKSLKSYFDQDGGRISEHVAAIEYHYGAKPRIYQRDTSNGIVQLNPEQSMSTLSSAYGSGAFSSFVQTEAFNQLPANTGLYEDSYEVLAGHWPSNDHELVLVLDDKGMMSDFFEYTLGLKPHSELDEAMKNYYSGNGLGSSPQTAPASAETSAAASEATIYDYEQILGRSFSLVPSASLYRYDETYGVWTEQSEDTAFMKELIAKAPTLEIAGIVKPRDDNTTIIRQGIAYTAGLTRETMAEAASSQIVKDQLANPNIDVFTGKSFEELSKGQGAEGFDMSSLFSIDAEAIQAAFRIDPNALQMDLSGLDFSSINMSTFDLSTLDMSSLEFTPSDLDAAALANSIDPSALSLDKLNLGELIAKHPKLAEIDWPTILAKGLEGGVVKPDAGRKIAEKLGPIAQGFLDYYQEHADSDFDGIPDVDPATLAAQYMQTPEVKAALEEALNSGQIIDLQTLSSQLAAALGEDPALGEITKDLSAQVGTAIVQTIAGQLSEALSQQLATVLSTYVHSAMTSAMTQMMTAISTAISTQMEQAMGGFAESMMNAFSFDESALAKAFAPSTSPEDLQKILQTMMSRVPTSYESNLAKLGWAEESTPEQINIYPTTFEDKDAVKAILDAYNEAARNAGDEAKAITYTDLVGLLMSSVTRIINIIKWMLIAFVSISLIVSSIMIAIITFISVLERKKEIGVLRSIGASRKDVSHVFNAETVIEGLLAGVIGIATTLLIAAFANAIVSTSLGVDNIAQLPVSAALTLIAISVFLTLIAGLLPARKAAKSDPVEALRSE